MCASTQISLFLIPLSLSGTLSHQEQKHRFHFVEPKKQPAECNYCLLICYGWTIFFRLEKPMFLLTSVCDGSTKRQRWKKFVFIWVLAHKEKRIPCILKGLKCPTHTDVRVIFGFCQNSKYTEGCRWTKMHHNKRCINMQNEFCKSLYLRVLQCIFFQRIGKIFPSKRNKKKAPNPHKKDKDFGQSVNRSIGQFALLEEMQ